ncbi:MAG: hypothetical protein JNN03_18195 [Rubrivivax sp.]|nr:hypothetical protein [Rubrivivax sp.]
MKTLLATLLACTLGLSAAPALASKPETPTAIAGAKVISVDEGKALAASKAATFIDTRSPVNFGKGRIPGAVIVAYKEKSEPSASFDASQDAFPLDKLPADKKARIVFYSDGPTGWKSYKAAVLAVKAGYTNVMYMRSGFAEWETRGLPVER